MPHLRYCLGTLLVFFTAQTFVASSAHAMLEDTFLYFPTHNPSRSQLTEWQIDHALVGYCRIVKKPRAIWLILHGNGGQSSDRQYIVDHLPADTCAYIMEYPGYGLRPGTPSMTSINAAASDAYRSLRTQYPGIPLCVLSESMGSGPACYLCSLSDPPDRLVLIVPFDNLLSVAKEHLPFLPVAQLIRDKWDNVKSLAAYHGPVDIYGAKFDTVIPEAHARALAATIPQVHYIELLCGHNDWSSVPGVQVTNQ